VKAHQARVWHVCARRWQWLAIAFCAAWVSVPGTLRADSPAEHDAEEEASEHGSDSHHGHVTWRSILEGEEKWQFYGSVVNFGLLIYIVRRMSKKPLQSFLTERRDAIERGILEASEVKRTAEIAFNEYTERMKSLDSELAKLRQDVATAAARDRARIESEADNTVARFRAETDALIARQSEQLETQIRREVVAAATSAAERAVREASTPDDQRRLAEAFARELGKLAEGAGATPQHGSKPEQAA
jgi:F-type H+-transporting ATPase subunit b